MKNLTIELPRLGVVVKPRFSDHNFSMLLMQMILPGGEFRELKKTIQKEHTFPGEIPGITNFIEKIKEVAETQKENLVEEVMLDPVLGRYEEPEYISDLAIELCKFFPSLVEEGYLSCNPGCINLDVEDISAIVLALLTEFLQDMFGTAKEKLEEADPKMAIEPKVEERQERHEPTDEEIILAYRKAQVQQTTVVPPAMYPARLNPAIARANIDDPFEV